MIGKNKSWKCGVRIMRAVFSLALIANAALEKGVLAEVIASFNGGGGAWHLGTFATANLDSQPDLEIVVPYRDSTGSWFLDAFKHTGQRLAGFPYAAGGDALNVSPSVADLDNDGRDEILFTRANNVIALRANGTVLWTTQVNPGNYVPDGGFHTVTNGFYWSTGQFISRLPATAVFSSEVSSPVVADLSADGCYEVFTAWKIDPDPADGDQDYNPHIARVYGAGQWGLQGEAWSGSVISFDAVTGRRTFVYHLHQLVEAGLAVGRAERGGRLHIYELNDSDSVVAFDKSKPFGLWGKGMLHKQFGKNQRLMTGSYHYPIDIQAADIDGDGLDEVLVPGTQASSLWQPNETILDDDGAILWRRWLPHTNIQNNAGWLNSASLIACNPDHDNRPDVLGWNHSYEVTFRTWNGAELVDRKGWPKSFHPLLPTPPVVGDVDGDGKEEIVIGTYNPAQPSGTGALHVFALDGTTKLSLPVAGGIKHVPALADIRGIGRCDVVYRTTQGAIVVHNLGGNSTNAISWATHRGNMRRDANLGRSLYPAGTPLINSKEPGNNRASFTWSCTMRPALFRIFRTENPDGPFINVATVTGDRQAYTDGGLKPGTLYYYEVAADFGSNMVRSVPFTVLSFLNGNLLANSGFEECENSHWDKWFTGTLGMTNMTGRAAAPYQGNRSMRLHLQQQDSSGSVAQFSQYGIPDSTIYVTPGEYYSFGGFIRSGGLSQPSEHWLEWGSAKTGHDTNARPTLPWPNYFTPAAAFGTIASDWVYVNRTFRLPAGFPNLEMYHRFKMSAPGSGSVFLDNLFFRHIPSPQGTNWSVLLPFGAEWQYLTKIPPVSWETPEFAASDWPVGRAKFGAGGGPTNVVTQLPQFRPAYYFRRTFLAPQAELDELLLSATCTDDSGSRIYPLQVWINGVKVNSVIDVVTGQGNQVRHFDLTPMLHLLRRGTNLIAIRVENAWSSWDDVAFDVSLRAIPSRAPSSRLSVSWNGRMPLALTTQPHAGSVWTFQSRDDQALWQTIQTWTNQTGEAYTVLDSGQNGRLPPWQAGNRMYRLIPF